MTPGLASIPWDCRRPKHTNNYPLATRGRDPPHRIPSAGFRRTFTSCTPHRFCIPDNTTTPPLCAPAPHRNPSPLSLDMTTTIRNTSAMVGRSLPLASTVPAQQHACATIPSMDTPAPQSSCRPLTALHPHTLTKDASTQEPARGEFQSSSFPFANLPFHLGTHQHADAFHLVLLSRIRSFIIGHFFHISQQGHDTKVYDFSFTLDLDGNWAVQHFEHGNRRIRDTIDADT